MISFKEFLEEAANNADSATKVRNHLVKKHGAESRSSSIPSNPYSDYQTLHARHRNPEKLSSALKDAGWEHAFHHNDGNGETAKRGNIEISIKHKGEHRGSVGITGPKKAKKSNLPYYD